MPALTSVALNVVMIVFAAWIAPHTRAGLALAIGVFVGGVIQLVFQVPALLRLGLLRRPRWNSAHEGVRRIGRLMVPAILGSSMGQISLLLSTSIASLLATAASRGCTSPIGWWSFRSAFSASRSPP